MAGRADRQGPEAAQPPAVNCALILAAGRGSRLQSLDPKPLLPLGGQPLLERSLQAYLEAEGLDSIYVVLGYRGDAVRAQLAHLDERVHWLQHEDWEAGLGTSLARGVAALPQECQQLLVGLADMPWISSRVVEQLLRFDGPEPIVAPTYLGQRGHPVLFRRSLFGELSQLQGDRGAASLLNLHPTYRVEVEEPGILRDVDRPQDVPRLPRVVIWGGGDLATGVAHRLHTSGFPVLILELPQPRMLRWSVALGAAVWRGQISVEGVLARHFEQPPEDWRSCLPVVVDPQGHCLNALRPEVLVDARMLKRNPGLQRHLAPLVVALGPGYCAGEDCHCVIETERGHQLGRVLWQGEALPDTGVPGSIGGQSARRVVRAPATGTFQSCTSLGQAVSQGQILGSVGSTPVVSQLDGLLRGLMQDGVQVVEGEKVADIDPRLDTDIHTISDKARAIGGGVLEAILCRYFG